MLKKMLCLAVFLMAAHSTAWATVTPVDSSRRVVVIANSLAEIVQSTAGGNFTVSKTVNDQSGHTAHAEQDTTFDYAAGHFFGSGSASAVDENDDLQDSVQGDSVSTARFEIDSTYRYDLHALFAASADGGSAVAGAFFYRANPNTGVVVAGQTSAGPGVLNASGLLGPGTYFIYTYANTENDSPDPVFNVVDEPSAFASAHASFSFELQLTPTPEPATFVLVGLAGAGLLLRRRRVA